jgi:uncharacterized protein
MNRLSVIVFISIAASIYAGLHYYVYQRLASGLALSGQALLYFRIFIYIGAASFFLSEVLSRRITSPWWEGVAWTGFAWLGVISIAFTALVFRDILLIFLHNPAVKYWSAVATVVIIAITCSVSVLNGLRPEFLRAIELSTDKLPKSSNGFTIAQLSDMHIDLQTPPWWVKDIVQKTNALNPDVILVTGDVLDADLRKKPEFIDILSGLKAKYGVFAVIGNHECFTGLEMFTDVASRAGMRLLRNENITAGPVTLVGIDDPEAIRFKDGGPDLDKALSSPHPVDMSKPVILLSHRPEIFDKAAVKGIDLTLAGHTHYGQIPPVDLFVKLFEKYSCGFYSKGNSAVYTTSGTGTWGPPMRLFSRNEIAKIVLRPL